MRYCERVGMISFDDLQARCSELFERGEYKTRKKRFAIMDGVWWTYTISKETMYLITCYGLSDYDIPTGLAWAAIHRDALKLSSAE
ncbi:hypothetical protein WMW72_12260 [Paenibacillus filicis]|uniref:Uncharacterized protein n=1 Tax=Paenibacillus filicis TaxID=669464 RepID=A0ABU9DIK7_9BACL